MLEGERERKRERGKEREREREREIERLDNVRVRCAAHLNTSFCANYS